ncbi:hypothetical protein LX32DRAFT_633924 [Colletotrichum zoysiae]|uniref:Uncharacterized protein n=1 Tax=Colletotrichum zoysiae TaxID=1216348 RepID=A0AAD9HUZ5_9PEZI|nr:hypothetical protein LX32DRAFT_633924 [Colletotrichum zoysiae]
MLEQMGCDFQFALSSSEHERTRPVRLLVHVLAKFHEFEDQILRPYHHRAPEERLASPQQPPGDFEGLPAPKKSRRQGRETPVVSPRGPGLAREDLLGNANDVFKRLVIEKRANDVPVAALERGGQEGGCEAQADVARPPAEDKVDDVASCCVSLLRDAGDGWQAVQDPICGADRVPCLDSISTGGRVKACHWK